MPDILTSRQREILDYISSSIDDRGFPPTLREIGQHFGIRSTNGVNDHLKALEKKGFLSRDTLKSRAMRPIEGRGGVTPISRAMTSRMGEDYVEVQVLGRVAAGQPLLAVENVEDTVKVDRFFLGASREVFALRVVGESMIDDGIFDGDYVFVKKTATAGRGEIVIVMIEGEATCKRYFPEGDRIRFQPANSNMQPIYVMKSEFRSVDIIGVVVGVYRRLPS
jgi:repressor LexA